MDTEGPGYGHDGHGDVLVPSPIPERDESGWLGHSGYGLAPPSPEGVNRRQNYLYAELDHQRAQSQLSGSPMSRAPSSPGVLVVDEEGDDKLFFFNHPSPAQQVIGNFL